MQLPDIVRVQLSERSGTDALGGVLIVLDLLFQGRYYYGTLLGLSDTTGRAAITGDKIRQDFARDQSLFPMDYKLGLDACDPMLVLRVPSGEEFLIACAQNASNSLVAPDAKEMWRRARNARYCSSVVQVEIPVRAGELSVTLPIELA